jgi:hypothetical protein
VRFNVPKDLAWSAPFAARDVADKNLQLALPGVVEWGANANNSRASAALVEAVVH